MKTKLISLVNAVLGFIGEVVHLAIVGEMVTGVIKE